MRRRVPRIEATEGPDSPPIAELTRSVRDLGVRASSEGGQVRVWSGSATAIEACIFAPNDPSWLAEKLQLTRDEHGVWSGSSSRLVPGAHYSLRASGPR